jgi:hypothetical protein
MIISSRWSKGNLRTRSENQDRLKAFTRRP